jgi:predicted nucleic acid-binding protein
VSFVLDSSATLAWLYPEELTDAIASLYLRFQDEQAWVPGLWRIEVANCLSVGIRRGRITAERRDLSLVQLSLLPIICDSDTDRNAWHQTLMLADRHKLTVYDATYLELALRRSLPLATLDRELRFAAQAEGLMLLGL